MRILIVDDNPYDAELMQMTLVREGIEAGVTFASDRTEFLQGIEYHPDVVLLDHSLGEFSALDALDIARENGVDSSFIVVSGSIGDEAAAECIKRGASDYVLKDRIGRLPQAVQMVIAQRDLEQSARKVQQRHEELIERLPTVVYSAAPGPDGQWLYCSPHIKKLLGFTAEEWMESPSLWYERLHPVDRSKALGAEERSLAEGIPHTVEYRMFDRDGRMRWVRDESTIRRLEDGSSVFDGLLFDITDAKKAEALVSHQAHVLEMIARGASLQACLQAIGVLVEQALAGARCCIQTLDRDAGVFRNAVSPSLPDEYLDALDGLPVDPSQGSFGAAASSQRSVFSSDISVVPEWEAIRELAATHGLEASWSVPVLSADETSVLGTLDTYYLYPRDPSLEDLDIIEQAKRLAAVALENYFAERDIATSEARKSAILRASLDCIITLNHQGQVIEFNEAAERTFGFSQEEAMGRDIAELIIPERLRAAHHAGFRRYVDSGGRDHPGKRVELPALRKDGSEFLCEIAIAQVDVPGDPVFTAFLRDISERKAIEEAVAESEERYRSLVQNSRDALAIVDASAQVRYLTPSVKEILGYEVEELIGTTGFEFVHEEDLPIAVGALETLLADPSRVASFEIRARKKSGEWIWLELRLTNRLSDPAIQGLVVNYHDITHRRLMEDALRESEEIFRGAFRASRSGLVLIHPEGAYIDVNDAFCTMVGYSKEELLSMDWLTLTHPEDRTRNEAESSDLIAGRVESMSVTKRYIHKDGHTIWVEVSDAAARDQDGRAHYIVSQIQDITESKAAAEALRQSKELLQALLDNSPAVIYIKRLDGKYELINHQYREIFQVGNDEVVGRTDIDLHGPDIGAILQANDRLVVEAGVPQEVEEVVQHANGTMHTYISLKFPLFDADGEAYALCGVSTDITERTRAQRLMAEREENFRLLFESNPIPMWVHDVDTLEFLAVNKAMVEKYGWTEEELLRMDATKLRRPEDVPVLLETLKNAGPGERLQGTWRHVTRAGENLEVNVLSHPLTFSDRRSRLVVAEDVTAQREAERERERLHEQLRQSQKMEAVGQLAGGIAHDFNNLLSVIINYGEFMSSTLGPEHESSDDLEEIRKAADRAATLVKQLLSFSRKEVVHVEQIDLGEIVMDMHELLRRTLGEHITLDVEVDEPLHLVAADLSQIEQILMNLAVNARDAMEAGGHLVISARNDRVDFRSEAHSHLAPGDYVRLVVRDTGHGMDPEVMERAFEPFFTTKPRGQGTGLGLATVYGIVASANGHILVESTLGEGTTISVLLPADHAVPEVPVAEQQPLPLLNEGGTVLLVEDEEGVRKVVERMLSVAGYLVLSASSGREALELLDESVVPDLVLTDVIMPEMSGKVLVDLVRERHPELPVVYMSGYTDDIISKRGVWDRDEGFIQKPFTAQQLLDQVRAALDKEAVA